PLGLNQAGDAALFAELPGLEDRPAHGLEEARIGPGPEPEAGFRREGADDLDAGDDLRRSGAREHQLASPLVPVEALIGVELEVLLVLVDLRPHLPVGLEKMILELLLGHRIHGNPKKRPFDPYQPNLSGVTF